MTRSGESKDGVGAQHSQRPRQRAGVLVVDDVEANLVALEGLLADLDCDVVTARSGSEALRQLLRRTFAVALLDVQMPEMDGYEVAHHMRGAPHSRDVPIIFLTAATETEDRVLRGYGSGAVDFLFKPISAAVLVSKVRVFIDLFRAKNDIAQAAAAHAALAERLQRSNEELNAAYRELQAAQAQLIQTAKMASLGQLVAGIAHEINNPLSFSISHLQTSQKSLAQVQSELGELPPTAARHWQLALARLDKMSLGLERVRDLVVKLRTFSRLDEGERKRVSVRESVESVLTILGSRLNPAIQVDTHFGAPDLLDCYPGPLNQAITNLVANAIDAIGESGALKIDTGARDGAYEIRVTDDGPGIPESIRDRVFDPFFTTKPVGSGTGLGLSITYAIVKRHGGSLDLRDAPGGGTSAVIRLPIDDSGKS